MSILLHISQQDTNGLTHLTLLLLKSKVVLRYDLGDGLVTLSDDREIIKQNEWCNVDIELKGRYASLRLNKKQATKNSSKGRSISLRLSSRSIVSIGGYGKITKDGGISKDGFHGCVQQLRLNKQKIDLVGGYEEAHRFSSCYSVLSPCLSQPCLNKGKCHTTSVGQYNCTCPKMFEGERCERRIKMCGVYLGCKNGGRCWMDPLLFGRKLCRCPVGFGGGDCKKSMCVCVCELFITWSNHAIYLKE